MSSLKNNLAIILVWLVVYGLGIAAWWGIFELFALLIRATGG